MEDSTINQSLHKNKYDEEEWNSCLSGFTNNNIFQSYEWGELKKHEGWDVVRVKIKDDQDGEILIAQIITKRIFGVKIGWCPGGPLIKNINNIKTKYALDEFKKLLSIENLANLRCKPFMEDSEINRDLFSNFIKPINKITSRKTNVLIVQKESIFLEQMKKKHRYYIKQSQRIKIDWKIEDSEIGAKTFLDISQEMQKNKRLKLPMINLSLFGKLFNKSKTHQMFTLSGYHEGDCIVSCVISIFNNKAFYHYAASSAKGRDCYASYGMIYHLMKYLYSLGVHVLDFGGLSEDGSSVGVDSFKEGFNGEEVLRIGEFDISKSKLHNYIFNKAVNFKKNL